MEKSKPYRIASDDLNYLLTEEDASFAERERLSLYNKNKFFLMNPDTIITRKWSVALYYDDWGSRLSSRLIQRLVDWCQAFRVVKLFGMQAIEGPETIPLEEKLNAYKRYFDPPLVCTLLPKKEAISKLNNLDYSLLSFSSFLLFCEKMCIFSVWDFEYHLIAGPKETVEYLIDGDCKSSWQKLAEPWFYEDPDRHYDDLRQFAKELGYFDGDVSRPPSDAESS